MRWLVVLLLVLVLLFVPVVWLLGGGTAVAYSLATLKGFHQATLICGAFAAPVAYLIIRHKERTR